MLPFIILATRSIPREGQSIVRPDRDRCVSTNGLKLQKLNRFWKFEFITECNITLLPFILYHTLANPSHPREGQSTVRPERLIRKYEWFETSTVKSVLFMFTPYD